MNLSFFRNYYKKLGFGTKIASIIYREAMIIKITER